MSIGSKEDGIGSLELEALKRKERLSTLKRKLQNIEEKNEEEEETKLPRPKFRSYQPEDERLKENVLPSVKPENVEEQIKDHLDATVPVIEELDLNKLAPKKPDWDLKREIEKKLGRLERRTNKAIAELIRERLKNNQTDLVTSVNIGALANRKLDVDEDD